MGDRVRLELLQGTLDLLVLKALSAGPTHGYGVARWIQDHSNDTLAVEEGSLYPALHRMARRGWLEAEWGVSENNRRARFYRLTAKGRRQLDEEARLWRQFTEVVAGILSVDG